MDILKIIINDKLYQTENQILEQQTEYKLIN